MQIDAKLKWLAMALLMLSACCQAFVQPHRGHHAPQSSTLFASSSGPPIHHMAIKTRDIELAIKFYSLLDFEVESKFLAGNVRAAWLRQQTNGAVRLELLEVPSHMLGPQSATRRAVDLVQRQELLGLNHYALDVTMSMKKKNMKDLQQWLDYLNGRSKEAFGKTLRIAVKPMEQIIGQHLYQLAFIYDSDGAIIELLYQQKKYKQEMIDGWYV